MSRLKLEWFNFTKQEGQDLCLKIPICDVYGKIIDRAFPYIEHIGWRSGTKGTCFTYIKHITPDDNERLTNFLSLLQKVRCITITPHLAPHFGSELDEAYALDFNFKQDVYPLAYTEFGTLEHHAKESQNGAAIEELSKRLGEVIQAHPTLNRAELIAAMPRRPSSSFHLPEELVIRLGHILKKGTGLNLVKAEHPKLRSLPMQDKLTTLGEVFSLNESVQGKRILVIDDLYQSGTTLWSLAKFLKSHGAYEVYGLTCVKSWSDTDNL